MKKCNCTHVGHCPFQSDPLIMVDQDGKPLFRALVEEQNLNDPLPGDFVGTDQKGTVIVLGRALDPEAVIAYSKTKLGAKCKADSFMWRKRHPAPRRDK